MDQQQFLTKMFNEAIEQQVTVAVYKKLHSLMGISKNRLTRILKNPKNITPEELTKLSKHTGIGYDFFEKHFCTSIKK